MAGYQAWFATPHDDDDSGWVHWGRVHKNGTLGIGEDYWPEMEELSAEERHPAPGYTDPRTGKPASLFSSDCAPTVLRHFQWMQA